MEVNDSLSIREKILTELYSTFSKGERLTPINDLCNVLGKSEKDVHAALEGLHKEGLSSAVTNDSYNIPNKGIITIETKQLASASLISGNEQIREGILNELAVIHEQYSGSQSLHVQNIADSIGVDVHIVLNNIDLLEHLQLVENQYLGTIKITDFGLADLQRRRLNAELLLEFQRISAMDPHNRGREFQNFFGRLALREGWNVDVSVKTSNEEFDVVIYRTHEFYLIECKWENKPIEARVIRDFFAKLELRDGVMGIIISMSGFTSGSLEDVRDRMGRRVILLFGPADIRSIVTGNQKLNDLIHEKHTQLIIKRSVTFN
jgi:hypothetical protein